MSEQALSAFEQARLNQEKVVRTLDVTYFGVPLRIHKKSAWEKQRLEFMLADQKTKLKFRQSLIRTYVTDQNNQPFLQNEAQEKELMTLFDATEVEALIERIMSFTGWTKEDRAKLDEEYSTEYPEGN